jgi:hypothetical protein
MVNVLAFPLAELSSMDNVCWHRHPSTTAWVDGERKKNNISTYRIRKTLWKSSYVQNLDIGTFFWQVVHGEPSVCSILHIE